MEPFASKLLRMSVSRTNTFSKSAKKIDLDFYRNYCNLILIFTSVKFQEHVLIYFDFVQLFLVQLIEFANIVLYDARLNK